MSEGLIIGRPGLADALDALGINHGAVMTRSTDGNFAPLHPREVKLLLESSKDGSLKNTRSNIKMVLENDARLSGLFKFNEMTQSIWVCHNPGWKCPSDQYELRDVDLDQLLLYLENEYDLRDAAKIQSVLNVVANNASFNPVREYFENELPAWDGKPHIENLLPDYLGAEKSDLNTEIMKLVMLGAINRMDRPGCKYDYVLILFGPQGIGKSYFLSEFAINPDWYSDNFNTVQGDAAFEKLRGVWIAEMAELLATKNAQTVESIKAFITSRVDRYRKKYGRVTEAYPRRCIFTGTTNSYQFLQDRSGNRRFLPIQCYPANIRKPMFEDRAAFRSEILQAWAEAYHIFKSEDPDLVLPAFVADELRVLQDAHLEDDYRTGLIIEYLRNLQPPRRVCALELWERALFQGDKQPTRKDIRDISEIMRIGIDGWKYVGRKRCRVDGRNYGMQNCIEPAHLGSDHFAFESVQDPAVQDF